MPRIVSLPTRRAQGLNRPRSTGGPGVVAREDPDENWRVSHSGLFTGGPRDPEIEHGARGSYRITNRRSGDVERRYTNEDDPRRIAGIRYRGLLERAMGGSVSTLARHLEEIQTGVVVDKSTRAIGDLTAAQADAMTQWVRANELIGNEAVFVLGEWLTGSPLGFISRRKVHGGRLWAGTVVDTALDTLAKAWGDA